MSRPRIVCVLLALATLLVYLPVGYYGFADYDDRSYITQNPMVQAGLTWKGVKWAFTTAHASNWHPLTWLSHMLDCQLFGLSAGGPHLVNVLFHTLNAVLLFVLLLRLTSAFWQSTLIAALFAWHPLRVESVAWVAERKDVLSACFGLLTLTAYVRYAERVTSGKWQVTETGKAVSVPDVSRVTRHSSPFYGLALLFFALGLMSKPMLVTLPFVLLLLDYWPLQRVPGSGLGLARWSRLVLEKGPFFALAAASCVVTFIVQQHGEAVVTLTSYPLRFRLENAVVAYVEYLLKSVWPVHLAVIYPLPKDLPLVPVLAATMTLILISWLVWRRRRPEPYLLTGWLWFLGMLVPVIGLVQVGLQSMADRYTYLPQIGLFLGATFCIGHWAAKLRLNPGVMISVAGIVLSGCLILTARQLQYWRDSETLFRHALAVTQDNSIAQNNLGYIILQRGQVDEAIIHFRKALGIRANYADAYINLGVAFAQKGQVDEAIAHLQKALEILPDSAQAHNDLGFVLFQKRQVHEAVVHYQRALEIQPSFVLAQNNLADALLRERQVDEVIAYCRRLLEADTNSTVALNNLAWLLATVPDPYWRNGGEAVRLAERACQLTQYKEATMLGTLAAAYAEAGRFNDAVATAQKARTVALAHGQKEVAARNEELLALYQSGRAYHQEIKTVP
jgi:Flp pilus assembly protein TadD